MEAEFTVRRPQAKNTEDDRPPPEAIGGKEESSPRSFRETADNLVSDF